MGRIQSTIGLVTGLPIQETVNQLLSISARPRGLLISRNQVVQEQQLAITELTALALGVEFAADNLGKLDAYEAKSVESSDSSLLEVVIDGEPSIGERRFTPVRQAQTQGVISSGIASLDAKLGAGELTFRYGGFVDQSIELDLLNGGAGVHRGEIRITDRSGSTATIDLRLARTVDDVLEAINTSNDIDVTASTLGDQFILTDNTSQTVSNLMVREADGGSTAADLGFTDVSVDANQVVGADVVELFNNLTLNLLNDGAGIGLSKTLPELNISFSDGSESLNIDFGVTGGIDEGNASTLIESSDARLQIRSKLSGGEHDGVNVLFVDDENVTVGSERIEYDDNDPNNRTLTVFIDQGRTTAGNVTAAFRRDAQINQLFDVQLDDDASAGALIIDGTNTTLDIETQSASGVIADSGTGDPVIRIMAQSTGDEYNGVTIRLVDESTMPSGTERVIYDDSDPDNKTLTFLFEPGKSTANSLLSNLGDNAEVSALFTGEIVDAALAANRITAEATSTISGNGWVQTDFATADVVNPENSVIQMRFTAVNAGDEYNDVTVRFIDEASALFGSERVVYDDSDPENKTLTFLVELDKSQNSSVLSDLENNAVVSALFRGEVVGDEAAFHAIVNIASTGVTSGGGSFAGGVAGQPSTSITFTAKELGKDLDDVVVQFIHDTSITRGNETVVYDDSDPEHKRLIFRIQSGVTTAADIVNALENDEAASEIFGAELADSIGANSVVAVGQSEPTDGGGEGDEERPELTIGELIETINAADPDRLRAEISIDGDRIVLTDLTAGDGQFSVKSAVGSLLAEELGLLGTSDTGVIEGRRLQAGLKTTLLTSFSGGRGVGELGSLAITDRSGATASVDLSTTETLQDVVTAINAAGISVTARVNDARNGLLVSDTSGVRESNLIIVSDENVPLVDENGDSIDTAALLGIAIDDAVDEVDSGSLDRQVVSMQTRLDSLNQGRGIDPGKIIFVASDGGGSSIDITDAETVGEVITRINALSIGIEARINDAGDGILLSDTADGSLRFRIEEVGGGTTAESLGFTGESIDMEIDGETRQVFESSTTFRVEITEDDTLEDLIEKINEFDSGVTAASFNSGSGITPYRLTLSSGVSGKAGELLIDTSGFDLSFDDTTKAQDALLLVGSIDGGGILATSSDNVFRDAAQGLTLTVKGEATEAVSVSVETSDSRLISGAKLFADQYNKLRDKIDLLTAYSEVDNTRGVLFGSAETLRIENDLNRLLTGRFFGLGSIQTLKAVGLTFKNNGFESSGKLAFDEEVLRNKFKTDPEGVKEFFTNETHGAVKKIRDLMETMAGRDRSLLVTRAKTLAGRFESNNARIANMTARLESQREMMLKEFYLMEITIGKLRNNLSTLDSLQILKPIQAN